MPATDKNRKLLRQFRKEIGATLDGFSKSAGLSEAMISRFENGNRDLSTAAWSRILETVSKLAQGEGNPRWTPAKREEGIRKAQATAAKLGVAVAQSLSSPTLEERLNKYFGIDADDYNKEQLVEMFNDVLEIAQQAMRDNLVLRGKEQFSRTRLDKSDAGYRGLKDVLGLRDKQILAKEAEQQKVDALGLESIPSPEHDTLRAEIEEHSKKGKSE